MENLLEHRNVFISYKTGDSTNELVFHVAKILENEEITCYFAPRDMEGQFANQITKAINSVDIFILLYTKSAADSENVLSELQIGFNRLNEKKIKAIIPFMLDDSNYAGMAIEYYISRQNQINAYNNPIDKALGMLVSECKKHLVKKDVIGSKRINNDYYSSGLADKDDYENMRLHEQTQLIAKFEKPIIDNFIEGVSLSLLDIGCSNGELTNLYFGDNKAISHVLGIDISNEKIALANKQNHNSKFEFKTLNIFATNAPDVLCDYLDSIGRNSFDVIYISMLLLHLEDPLGLLKRIKNFVHNKTKIIIKDIDDGFNVAFPDKNGIFSKYISCIGRNSQWGYRYSGRQIFSYLEQNGCTNIKLAFQCVNNLEMNYKEKKTLFDIYFPYKTEQFNKSIKENELFGFSNDDYAWLKNNIDNIHNEYFDPQFFFSLGFMIYTAEF